MTRGLWLACRQYWSASPLLVLISVALSLPSGMLPVGAALLTQRLLNVLTSPHRAVPFGLIIALVLCGAAVVAAQHIEVYLDQKLRRAIAAGALRQVFARVNEFPGLERFEDPVQLDELRLAQQAGSQTPKQIGTAGIRVIRSVVSLSGFAIAVWTLWPPILVLVVLAVLPAAFIELKLAKIGSQLQQTTSRTYRRRFFYEMLLTDPAAAKELRLFGSGTFLFQKLMAALSSIDRAESALDRKQAAVRSMLGLLGQAVIAAGVVIAAGRVARGDMLVGDLVLLLAALTGVQGATLSIVMDVSASYKSLLLFRSYQNLIGEPSRTLQEYLPVPVLRDRILIRDVWFRYNDDSPWVLRGVNLAIGKGQSIGLVGENGAGKSTLVKLLCRLYEPQRGTILWDGVDIRDFDPAELRSRIGAVFQDFVRYDLTAAENIGMGRLEALTDRERIRHAATLAGADSFLSELPRGYDTLLSRTFLVDDGQACQTGTNLSGGQWQRVALARSLMRGDADLLILDEPSSGLDANAEDRVHKTLHEHRQGRTSVLVSHRLGSLRPADVIFVLSGGIVAESGSHDELTMLGGIYAEMFGRQAVSYQASAGVS